MASLGLRLKELNMSCHWYVSVVCTNLLCSRCISDGLQQECDLGLARDCVIRLLQRKWMDSGMDETRHLVNTYRCKHHRCSFSPVKNKSLRWECHVHYGTVTKTWHITHACNSTLWHISSWNRCWSWFINVLNGWSTNMGVTIKRHFIKWVFMVL